MSKKKKREKGISDSTLTLTGQELATARRNTVRREMTQKQIRMLFENQLQLEQQNEERLEKMVEERLGIDLDDYDLTDEGQLIKAEEPGFGTARALAIGLPGHRKKERPKGWRYREKLGDPSQEARDKKMAAEAKRKKALLKAKKAKAAEAAAAEKKAKAAKRAESAA